MTSTPATNSPNTPSVLTCLSFGWLFGVLREGTLGGGAGALRAGGIGAKGLAPGEGDGAGAGLAVCAATRGAAIRSATSAAMAVTARILGLPRRRAAGAGAGARVLPGRRDTAAARVPSA